MIVYDGHPLSSLHSKNSKIKSFHVSLFRQKMVLCFLNEVAKKKKKNKKKKKIKNYTPNNKSFFCVWGLELNTL